MYTSFHPPQVNQDPLTCDPDMASVDNGTIIWYGHSQSGDFTCDPLFDLYPTPSVPEDFGTFHCSTGTAGQPQWVYSAQCKQREFIGFVRREN